jgi:hypothetical protein
VSILRTKAFFLALFRGLRGNGALSDITITPSVKLLLQDESFQARICAFPDNEHLVVTDCTEGEV